MNRRHFNLSALLVLSVPMKLRAWQKDQREQWQSATTSDGLILELQECIHPNEDHKQMIMTFNVAGETPLEERIYEVTDANGRAQPVYMTPVNNKQLQAIFNWRTHA